MPSTADLLSKISSDSDSDSTEKCRRRRRRRIEMRRMRTVSAQLSFPRAHHFQSPLTSRQTAPQKPHFLTSTHKQYLMEEEEETLPKLYPPNTGLVPPHLVENPMPAFGCISIQGLSKTMDDACFVKENLCRPHLFGGKPVHFFAVYDGHGGSHVSTLGKKMMHRIMMEELTRVQNTKATATDTSRSSRLEQAQLNQQHEKTDEKEWEDLVRSSIGRSFKRMDQVAESTCVCGERGFMCWCAQMMDVALAGARAVVALLTPHHIVVANCGDSHSRAVLCRDGRAIPLSLHHKPERRRTELQRIGPICCFTEVGDYKLLKSRGATRAEPEISITEREAEDKFLIVGSDGIWDVVSEELACEVATACLKDGTETTPRLLMFPSQPKFAAAILCRLALGRGSRHNITLIVVDLRNDPQLQAKPT